MKTLPRDLNRAKKVTPPTHDDRDLGLRCGPAVETSRKERVASPQTLQVLKLFARQPEQWRYGYELSIETGIPHGTIYNILLRLGRQGYLEDRWEIDDTGREKPRHLHRLNVEGIRYTARQLSA